MFDNWYVTSLKFVEVTIRSNYRNDYVQRLMVCLCIAYDALLDSREALATTVATASASVVVAAVPEMCG